jgi:alpha-glucosidase (family GH31 glycosyl hydrolase)
MEWWDGFSAVVDLTSPEGYRWFKAQLDRLVSTYGVDGFKFDGGGRGVLLEQGDAEQDAVLPVRRHSQRAL